MVLQGLKLVTTVRLSNPLLDKLPFCLYQQQSVCQHVSKEEPHLEPVMQRYINITVDASRSERPWKDLRSPVNARHVRLC